MSLAAALALPATTSSGDPLPYRDLIIAAAFIDILFTLVVQGLTMPAIVRWSKLPPDPSEFDEELLAEQTGLQAELDALPAVAERLGSPPPLKRDAVYRLRHEGMIDDVVLRRVIARVDLEQLRLAPPDDENS